MNYSTNFSKFLESYEFYFSHHLNLTHSYQREYILKKKYNVDYLDWKYSDPRFFWNKNLVKEFFDPTYSSWIVPLLDGCKKIYTLFIYGLNHFKIYKKKIVIKISQTIVYDEKFDYILISRRDCSRTGTRFKIRGADPRGNVANFVETEQIVCFKGNTSSFVQTRGSIPLLWQQRESSLKPKPTIIHSPFSYSAFHNHFKAQLFYYGQQILVNLVNKHPAESFIGEAYERSVRYWNDLSKNSTSSESGNPNSTSSNPSEENAKDSKMLSYHWFDFHEKCKGNKYENISELMNEIDEKLMSFSYFLMGSRNNAVTFQTGAVRTNCVDCLDRTNVVQSVIAKKMLIIQLSNLGIFQTNEDLSSHTIFESLFKNGFFFFFFYYFFFF